MEQKRCRDGGGRLEMISLIRDATVSLQLDQVHKGDNEDRDSEVVPYRDRALW